MKTLLGFGLVLIVLFSLGVGGYLAFFKTPFKAIHNKVLAFMVISAVATAVTFVLCLAAIWPSVM